MMHKKLSHRKATLDDLNAIVELLLDDELGLTREKSSEVLDKAYINAFHLIDADPHQYLMLVEYENNVVGTCHLTMIPSLTFVGSMRMEIEAVRIAKQYRGQACGAWMINTAIAYGRSRGAKIVQLTSNKKRTRAISFYENLGLQATHQGLKMYLNE